VAASAAGTAAAAAAAAAGVIINWSSLQKLASQSSTLAGAVPWTSVFFCENIVVIEQILKKHELWLCLLSLLLLLYLLLLLLPLPNRRTAHRVLHGFSVLLRRCRHFCATNRARR
jgi:hypothetical protein